MSIFLQNFLLQLGIIFNKNITAHQKAVPNIRTEATGLSRSNICTNSFLLLDLHLPVSLKGPS